MNKTIFKVFNRFSTNLKTFDSLENLNAYLLAEKPTHTVVYFRANWNPNCRQSDKDAEKLAANNAHLQVIKIDSDIAPKIAKHYSIKAEPEFVFCLYGDELLRQIGVNYAGLEEKLEKTEKFARETDLSSLSEKWVPYGTAYKVYYEQMLKQTYKSRFSDI